MPRISSVTRPPRAAALLWCLLLVATGCATERRDEQLGKVAKEWSKTIRASQVIPIYPLSEDLTVGDCFVVQRPTEDEVELWNQKGFLPLTHHVLRLPVDNYQAFYPSEAYGVGPTGPAPARLWQRKPSGELATSQPSTQPVRAYHTETNWLSAPRAAFPSFTVEVSTDAAGDLSLPVQGIPIGLSALNSQRAFTSVTLSDAFTYGVDADSLYAKITGHFARDQLRRYQPQVRWDGERESYRVDYSYLRVVQRVYLIGGVDVSVMDTTDTRGALAIFDTRDRKPEEVAKTLEERKGLAEARKKDVDVLNEALNLSLGQQLPGGSIRVTDKTSRSISLKQTFDRPLVVGYVSFDIPIGWGGALGDRIIATQVRLDSSTYDSVAEWAALYPNASAKLVEWMAVPENRQWLRSQRATELSDIADETSTEAAAEMLRNYVARPAAKRIFAGMSNSVRRLIPIGVLPSQNAYDQITARVLHDVIRRPEGIGPARQTVIAEDTSPAPGGQPATTQPAMSRSTVEAGVIEPG